ncbi:MAG: RagB/SusD family nutrient uptake outer membrane protein [Gelidibacter sp.]
MNTFNNKLYRFKIAFKPGLLIFTLLLSSCDKFLETDNPTGQIPHLTIFENQATATAAVTTMYAKLRDDVLLAGNATGLGTLMGCYADELTYYGFPNQSLAAFSNNQIVATDATVARLWSRSYNLIYMANAAIEGLQVSHTIPEKVRQQLLGEALFIRAMTHHYLVRLFGNVPYITTTDYEINAQVSRMQENLVYELVVTDLLEAKSLVGEPYVSNERIRSNKSVVSALLAKVYLDIEEWENAEEESSLLINNSAYNLELQMDNVFLKTSSSAILQLKSKNTGSNTLEATTYTFSSGPPPLVALNNQLVEAMDENDLRRTYWVGKVTTGTQTWYFSNKYKRYEGNGQQYSTVFRLEEQYLIRAEARAKLNDMVGANSDINSIRIRAGLAPITAVTIEETLFAIYQERRFELFAEHGHRWFDLKRFGNADEVLSPLKEGWGQTDILLPIPDSEILMNVNLNPQNEGY